MQKPSLFGITLPTTTFTQSFPVQSDSTYNNTSAWTNYQHQQINFDQKYGNNIISPSIGSVCRFMSKFKLYHLLGKLIT